MSVASLIDQYGRDVELRRPTWGKTAGGGPRIDGLSLTTLRVLIQNGGGSTGSKYGAERATYGLVGYCKGGSDVLEGDEFDYGGKRYRIDSLRVPDERGSGDALQYVILGLTQEQGVT